MNTSMPLDRPFPTLIELCSGAESCILARGLNRRNLGERQTGVRWRPSCFSAESAQGCRFAWAAVCRLRKVSYHRQTSKFRLSYCACIWPGGAKITLNNLLNKHTTCPCIVYLGLNRTHQNWSASEQLARELSAKSGPGSLIRSEVCIPIN